MCYLTAKNRRRKLAKVSTPTLPIRHQVSDIRPLVGKYPHCRDAMTKFGTESKLPCVSGIDNSKPFSTLSPLEYMMHHLAITDVPTEAPRPPRKRVMRYGLGWSFRQTKTEVLISDLLGHDSAQAHNTAVKASKEAAKLYK